MKNKLHSVHRIRIEDKPTRSLEPILEVVSCGCKLNADHTEGYEDYIKRGKKRKK